MKHISRERHKVEASDTVRVTVEAGARRKVIEPAAVLIASVEPRERDGALEVNTAWVGTPDLTREAAVAVAVAALDQLNRSGVLQEAIDAYNSILEARAGAAVDAAAHPPQSGPRH